MISRAEISDGLKRRLSFAKELVKKALSDDVPGLAAQLAFYLIMAFFPFLILLFFILALSPFLTEDLLYGILQALPDETVSLVWQILTGVARSRSIVVISAFLGIWSFSAVIGTVAKAINRFYGVEEKRHFVLIRLKGMLYVVVAVLLIIASFTVVVFGSLIGEGIATLFPGFISWWYLIRFGVMMLCVAAIFVIIFKKMPSKELKVTYLWQGAVFTAVSWGVASFVFSFYVDNFANYHFIYGSLAGLVSLITWLYMTAYIILLGGEINSMVYKRHMERQK